MFDIFNESKLKENNMFSSNYKHISCDDITEELFYKKVLVTPKNIEEEFDKIDILINCAGSSKDNGVLDISDEEWDFTIDTDLTSVFKVTREFANNHVPMKRYGKEGELITGAIFLASDEASYVTEVILPIDGGYTAI